MDAFGYLRQILPSNECFWPSKPIMTATKPLYPTNGNWFRLKLQSKRLVGTTKLFYLDRGKPLTIGGVMVQFPQPWADHQLEAVMADTKYGRPYEGYSISSFCIDAPARVSHSSDTLITLIADLDRGKIKIRPIVEVKWAKGAIASLSGLTSNRADFYHLGKWVTNCLIPDNGPIELFGFVFESADEVYKMLTHILTSEPLLDDKICVFPQLKASNEICVEHTIRQFCHRMAMIRGEVFNPKFVSRHTITVPDMIEEHFPPPVVIEDTPPPVIIVDTPPPIFVP